MTASGLRSTKWQLGFVVEDLDEAMEWWSASFGIGPWVVIEGFPSYERVHRDQPTDVQIVIALAYHGDLQVELVQQMNEAPSPYQEFLDAGRSGLQHIGIFSENYDEASLAMKRAGLTAVYRSGPSEATRKATYYEASDARSPMIEVVDLTPNRKQIFQLIKDLSEDWDGTEPIRRYPSMSAFVDQRQAHS